jgi:hypothetical protein
VSQQYRGKAKLTGQEVLEIGFGFVQLSGCDFYLSIPARYYSKMPLH